MFVKCISCQSTRLEPGRLTLAGDPSFIPQHAKFLSTGSHVKINIQACADCGLVMFSVDPDDLTAKADVGGQTETTAPSSVHNKLEPRADDQGALEIE
jgi:hypothetical protein